MGCLSMRKRGRTVMTKEQLDEQLHDFMHMHRNVMRRFFQSCGMFNGHPMMLFIIRQNPGLTQKQLAEKMNIAPASAAISLKRMEEAGLVRRTPDQHDGRVVHLHLTPEGVEMDDRCARGKQFSTEILYRDFSPEDLDQFSAFLTRMQHNLEKTDIQDWRFTHEQVE